MTGNTINVYKGKPGTLIVKRVEYGKVAYNTYADPAYKSIGERFQGMLRRVSNTDEFDLIVAPLIATDAAAGTAWMIRTLINNPQMHIVPLLSDCAIMGICAFTATTFGIETVNTAKKIVLG